MAISTSVVILVESVGPSFLCLPGIAPAHDYESQQWEFDTDDCARILEAAQRSSSYAAAEQDGRATPVHAQIEGEDSFALLDGDPTPLTLVGGTRYGARVRCSGRVLEFVVDGRVTRVEGAAIGIEDQGDLQSLASSTDPLLALTSDARPLWVVSGGAAGWLAERRQRKAREAADRERAEKERAAAKAAERQQVLHDAGDHFINPYTFVPLAGNVQRSAPNEHRSLLDEEGKSRLSGWFDLTFTTETPLVLASDQVHQNGSTLRYPGSSVRGMLRSLHEVIAHGCMSVIDPDYVPVHREAMKPLGVTSRLAVVAGVTESGRARGLQLTDEPEWIPIDCFDVPDLHSGRRVVVEGGKPVRVLGRLQRRDGVTVRPATGDDKEIWVAHVSDSGARERAKTYFVAVGKLLDETPKEISEKTWARFRLASRGTNDSRELRRGADGDTWDTSSYPPGVEGDWPKRLVMFRGRTVGYRRAADGWLSEGDTVWWTPGARGESDTIKLAAIWRQPGSGTVRERLPDPSLVPCVDPESLCPTCSVFGFVSQQSNVEKADQRAYGSHVRVVGPAESSAPVSTTEVELPPLGEPRPSAGGFYLVNSQEGLQAERKGHKTHWGSALDKTRDGARPIAGRKFYWHGQESGNAHGRHVNRQGATDGVPVAGAEMIRRVQVVPQGTALVCRVSFDNLSADQLRLLLLAADPTPLFRLIRPGTEHTYATHLGGAKPLGYGTATTSISGLHVQTAAQRYGGADSEQLTLDQARDPHGIETTEPLMGLESVMRVGRVPADRIWYPTTGNFKHRNSAVLRREFDKSFAFFARYTGDRNPMRALPLATDLNQYISGKDGDN